MEYQEGDTNLNFCTVCIKPFRLWKNQRTTLCSSCQAIAFKEKHRTKPKRGETFLARKTVRKHVHARTYRDKALHYYGEKCSTCGFDEHVLLLDVHHIDEDRNNNSLENLQVLCVMCHARVTRLGEHQASVPRLPDVEGEAI